MEMLIFVIILCFVTYFCFIKSKPTMHTRTELLKDGSWNLGTAQKELVEVVGESFKNSDGTDRQKIIKNLKIGDNINLIAEPNNPYSKNGKCVAVWSKYGQIGNLPEGDDKAERIFKKLIKNENVTAVVLDILGGVKDKPSFGVWLDVDI